MIGLKDHLAKDRFGIQLFESYLFFITSFWEYAIKKNVQTSKGKEKASSSYKLYINCYFLYIKIYFSIYIHILIEIINLNL